MNVPEQDEVVLYEDHPSMFRNHPVYFVLCVLLIAVGVGVIILFFWWLDTLATTLTVTNEQTTLRKGILSKHTNDVFHNNVRNIQVRQTVMQRLFNVGWIGISSAGQSGLEIEINGIKDPHRVKEIIDEHRN